jgi:hypothetical protein
MKESGKLKHVCQEASLIVHHENYPPFSPHIEKLTARLSG